LKSYQRHYTDLQQTAKVWQPLLAAPQKLPASNGAFTGFDPSFPHFGKIGAKNPERNRYQNPVSPKNPINPRSG